MAVQSVTLQLPDAVMQRAREAAQTLDHPVEEVLTTMLAAVLPDVDNVPADVRADLTRMTWLSDQELWDATRRQMPPEQQDELRKLAEIQTTRSLNQEERERLAELQREYGKATLRIARAYALLSLRGGRPFLTES